MPTDQESARTARPLGWRSRHSWPDTQRASRANRTASRDVFRPASPQTGSTAPRDSLHMQKSTKQTTESILSGVEVKRMALKLDSHKDNRIRAAIWTMQTRTTTLAILKRVLIGSQRDGVPDNVSDVGVKNGTEPSHDPSDQQVNTKLNQDISDKDFKAAQSVVNNLDWWERKASTKRKQFWKRHEASCPNGSCDRPRWTGHKKSGTKSGGKTFGGWFCSKNSQRD